jgi:RimJ/RimL family protein N-acetyltransferase
MELVTQRLYLREFRESDFPSVYSYESDSEVTQYVAYGPYTQAALYFRAIALKNV